MPEDTNAEPDRPRIAWISRFMPATPERRRRKQHRAAHKWWVRLEDAEQIESVYPQFESWLAADPGNRAAFLRLEAASRNLDRLSSLRTLQPGVNLDLLRELHLPPSGRAKAVEISWIGRVLTAAMLIILVIGGAEWWRFRSWKSYETAVGGHEVIDLSDGSSIDLNTNSQLRVRMTRTVRQLELLRGEVIVRVRHDPSRPFVV